MFLKLFNLLFNILFIPMIGMAQPLNKKEPGKPVVKVPLIEFYLAHRFSNDQGERVIRVFGRAKQEGLFKLSGEIQNFFKNHVTSVELSSVSKKKEFRTNETGHFSFDLILPPGQNQLPLEFIVGAEKPVDLVLGIMVSKEDVQLSNEKKKFEEKSSQVWVGLGGNFLIFDQDYSGTFFQFESFAVPEFSLGYEGILTNSMSLMAQMRSSPGATRSNATQVNEGRYLWQSFILDSIFYRDRNYPFFLFSGWKGRMQYRAGAQWHSLPFLKREGAESVNIENDDFVFLTIGSGIEAVNPLRNWKAKLHLRYLHSLSGGSSLKLNNGFGIEGVLGLYKMLNDTWSLGLLWESQYLQVNYSGLDDVVTNQEINGRLTLFHNSVQVRLSYSW